MKDLKQLITTRRSVRKWRSDPVPEEVALRAIELATWAPSGGNFQNWRFLLVSNRNLITDMADAVQKKVDTLASWPEASVYGGDVHRWQQNASFFRHAPNCIAVLMEKYDSIADKILHDRARTDPTVESMIQARRVGNAALQGVAAAIAYLLLGLHAQGLGAVWMVGPLLAKTELETLLRIPVHMNLVALVPFGFPDETPVKTRKPVTEVVDFYR